MTTPRWIPAALSRDLPAGTVIPVTIAGQDLALWRGHSGTARAWEDRCPHRGMRLSQGFVRDDMLSCLYHGWRYDGTGQCRKIPAHPALAPNKAIRVPVWHVAEAHGLLWIAPEPAGTPPDLSGTTPLRSLPVARPAGAPGTEMIRQDGLILLFQATGPGACMVHALSETPLDAEGLRAASRRLEALRRSWEAEGVPA